MAGLSDIYDEIIDKIATPKGRLLIVEGLKNEGKQQAVIHACKKVLEAFPDDIGIRRVLAETYFEDGSLDLAGEELDKITKEINKLSYIYKLESELFKRQNRIDDAVRSLQIYLAHNREDQEAADLLAEISRPEEAPSILATSTLAEVYYNQGELNEAIKMYEQVVASYPDNKKASQRLDELREEKEAEERRLKKLHVARERKLKLLGILEKWLTAFEQSKTAILRARVQA